jgi:hypothetical protein
MECARAADDANAIALGLEETMAEPHGLKSVTSARLKKDTVVGHTGGAQKLCDHPSLRWSNSPHTAGRDQHRSRILLRPGECAFNTMEECGAWTPIVVDGGAEDDHVVSPCRCVRLRDAILSNLRVVHQSRSPRRPVGEITSRINAASAYTPPLSRQIACRLISRVAVAPF